MNTTTNTLKTQTEYTHANQAGTKHALGYVELCRTDAAILAVRPDKNGSPEFAVWSFGVTLLGQYANWGFYSRSSAAALGVFVDRANVDPVTAYKVAVLGLVRCCNVANVTIEPIH